MNAAVIALSVVGLLLVVGALQWLSRVASSIPVEPFLRPLAGAGTRSKDPKPPELVALEVLVADALQGERSAMARLAPRLAALGLPIAPDASPALLLTILEALASGQGAGESAQPLR